MLSYHVLLSNISLGWAEAIIDQVDMNNSFTSNG